MAVDFLRSILKVPDNDKSRKDNLKRYIRQLGLDQSIADGSEGGDLPVDQEERIRILSRPGLVNLDENMLKSKICSL